MRYLRSLKKRLAAMLSKRPVPGSSPQHPLVLENTYPDELGI